MTMTNNPTIDGVSREDERHAAVKALHDVMQSVPSASLYSLAEAVLDAGYAPTCKTCGGSKTVFNLGFMSLDDGNDEPCPDCAPALEPANELREHCKQYAEVVKTWPEWKQNCLGGAPAVERQPDAWKCTGDIGTPCVTDSEDCANAWYSHGGTVERLYAEPPEVAALQSTIAQLEDKLNKAIDLDFQRRETIEQLQARISELESGSGEPVAELLVEFFEHGPMATIKWFTPSAFENGATKVFTAPPAPFAVLLPERQLGQTSETFNPTQAYALGWNACLDATAALNGERK